jgi:2-amino-4-hydroxy-6-hydroxymethyldihydropteridine diphosphokinase
VTVYAVGLGSNLGERLEHLRAANRRLRTLGTVKGVSGLYETAPVGGPEQDPYLNAVVVLDAVLGPNDLLGRLNEIEAEAGRQRITKWGPRTLDLDIVAMEPGSLTSEHLVVPHPRAREREFVLRPLCDVWPKAMVGPDTNARQALDELADQEVDLLDKAWVEDHVWPGRIFVATQFLWFITIALAMSWDGSLPDGEPDVLRIAGVALSILGGGLAFISSRRLGPGLTTMPEPSVMGALVQTGTYAMARHPMYGGVTLFILGASLILDSLTGTLLSLGLVPFFIAKSSYEENRLRIRFPQYRSYRQRVPRRLIPFLI